MKYEYKIVDCGYHTDAGYVDNAPEYVFNKLGRQGYRLLDAKYEQHDYGWYALFQKGSTTKGDTA